MPDAAGLLKIIKKAAVEAVEADKPVNLCFGIVTSASPLKINVEQKMELGEAQLLLSRNVTDYIMKLETSMETEPAESSHSHAFQGRTEWNEAYPHIHAFTGNTGESAGSHSHWVSGVQEVTVKNSLQAGEKVLLIRQQGGQKYFVLDRVIG